MKIPPKLAAAIKILLIDNPPKRVNGCSEWLDEIYLELAKEGILKGGTTPCCNNDWCQSDYPCSYQPKASQEEKDNCIRKLISQLEIPTQKERSLLIEYSQWLQSRNVEPYTDSVVDLFLRLRTNRGVKSECPYCSGSKIKPFMGTHVSQHCQECDQDGMIENSRLIELGLEGFIKK